LNALGKKRANLKVPAYNHPRLLVEGLSRAGERVLSIAEKGGGDVVDRVSA